MKVGKIEYKNVMPIYYYADQGKQLEHVEFDTRIPAALNHAMATGEIGVGPISSFSYAENHDKYQLMPDLSVSSDGKVRSIYLFSKKPLEYLDGSRIALTSSSATSVALLKVIMHHFYQLQPVYQTMPPHLPSMLQEHDAALLIGDDAIRTKWTSTTPYVYDLGELWKKWTNYTMTYAVWAIRKEWIDQEQLALNELYHAFTQSKQQARRHLDPIIQTLIQDFGGTVTFWTDYFNGLKYDFGPKQIEGLEYFYRLAYECGLLHRPCQVETWTPEQPFVAY
ncbi:menaquinone biosynthetic enzyme MqnA/MqnD family protein [Caldalkalibacillus salinus]|uniref:menaquinone biosynthetic enzyme MqnA/MqnD family protein n=1 Tax=Caldalkalibacillus salinus TaxID=2803787 RepID=UPI0019237704|nr:menaquinone biosynthesis protein [Caldalkalibacillus salinus]